MKSKTLHFHNVTCPPFWNNGLFKGHTQDNWSMLSRPTTIVGDIVEQVGGDHIQLTVLFPVGADPHTLEPRPQDAAPLPMPISFF